MANYKRDIVDINLETGNIFRSFLNHSIGSGDENADWFGFRVFRNGEPETIGGTCAGLFIRPDGGTVTIQGTVSENLAYVILPEACYAIEGNFTLAIKLIGGNVSGTIRIIDGTVTKTSTNVVIDPGTVIPSVEDLIDAIEEAVASIPSDYSALSDEVELLEKFKDSFVVNGTRAPLSTTGTTSKYWNCETSVAVLTDIANSDFRAFDPVAVSAGQVYTVYSKIGATHKARTWLVTDDNLNILAMPADEYGAGLHVDVIVIPDGGTKLLLTSSATANPGLKQMLWEETIGTEDCLKYRGSIQALGYTALTQCAETGWYGCGASYAANLTDLPAGYDTSKAVTVMVFRKVYNSGQVSSGTDAFHLQVLTDTAGHIYTRVITVGGSAGSWNRIGGGGASALEGATVAIIGDSISTNGNYGTGSNPNVPEIVITEDDVGVELHAYITYYDVYQYSNGNWVETPLTIGSDTFDADDIGYDRTFTPAAGDVGKVVGKPLTYNPNSTTVWWEIAMAELGFTPVPVCWSGASVTSHEGTTAEYKTSYAWHESQIRKCGVRTPGTMTRTAPDAVIIYRGTNDFSHAPYARLTSGLFDAADWSYPENDADNGVYGFKEGICKTVQAIRTAWPDAKIFLCTLNVFKRVNKDHYPTNNGYSTLPQYNNAIRECADYLDCGLIELDKCGITFENCYPTYIDDSSTTPTHPNDAGHRVMGLKAVADLRAQYSAMS